MRVAWVVLGVALSCAVHAEPPLMVATEIRGVVLDPHGEPLAGATVRLLPRGLRSVAVVATTTSDVGGRFSFGGAYPVAAGPLPPRFTVLAGHEGFGAGWALGEPRTDGAEVRLSPPTTLHLQVRNPAGQPLPGVALRLSQLQRAGGLGDGVTLPALEETQAVSDAAGEWRLADLPQGLRCRVQTVDDGLAIADDDADGRELARAAVTSRDPVTVQAAGVVEGRVTAGANGQPVAGVTVWAAAATTTGWRETLTDAEGRYRLTGLSPVVSRVGVVLTPTWQRGWAQPDVHPLPAGADRHATGVDFVLDAGVPLVCQVVDQQSGEPLAGLDVVASQSAGSSSTAATELDGRATLHVLPGRQVVSVRAYALTMWYDVRSTPAQTVVAEAGQPQTLKFQVRRLPAAEPVRGRVLTYDGHPVAGAELRLEPLALGPDVAVGPLPYRAGRTAQDGSFVMPLTGLNGGVQIRAHKGELASVEAHRTKPGELVELRLAPNGVGEVEAVVTDPQHRPLVNAAVTLWHGVPTVNGNGYYSYAGDEAEAVQTDTEGRARLRGCMPGANYSLVVEALGFNRATTKRFDVPVGRTLHLDPIALDPVAAQLAGSVVDETNQPVAGVDVVVYVGAVRRHAMSDGAGRFHLERLPEGDVSLSAASGAKQAHARVQSGATTAVLRLKAGP